MSIFEIKISDNLWYPICNAPFDGRIVFVRDAFGHVDLAKWINAEWSAEFGICSEFTHFAIFSLDDYV